MIEDLEPLKKYKFKVQAYNDVGDGISSKTIEIKTPAGKYIH